MKLSLKAIALLAFLSATNASSLFAQNDPLYISRSGNVGIGTDTPSARLDVIGDIRSSKFLRGDAQSFLYANGSMDATSNVVLRNDGTTSYLYPWGTPYPNNVLMVGGRKETNFSVTGNTELKHDVSVDGNAAIKGDMTAANARVTGSLRADAGSFLYSKGSTDATSNVVLRYDANNTYLYPWGTGTASNTVIIGGGMATNFTVTGNATMQRDLAVTGNITASKVNGEKQPLVLEIGDRNNTTNWYSQTADIGPLCGDADGCTIKIFFRVNNSDEVRTISEQVYIEQRDKSNNKTPGLSGFARQLGGGEQSFVLQTNQKCELIPHPWDWIYVRNYRSNEINGGRESNAYNDYTTVFMTRPNVSATVIIYDR